MKSFEKSAAAAFGLLVLAFFASPVHAAKYKINWFLGHPNLDYFEEAAANFKRTVETGSHGDISVEIVTKSDAAQSPIKDRTGPEIAAAVAAGEAQMGHSFTDVMGGMDARLWAFEAPYLLRDYRHMEGVIEGPIGAELLDSLRDKQLVGLSFTYSGGASGVASKREIRGPADLKGLKVGVYGDPVNAAWLDSLGATPVAIEHHLDGISGLARDGKLDAVVTTWRNFERPRLESDFKYVGMMGSTYLVSMTYINAKFFASLPADYQALIKDASLATGRIERAKTIELNESAKRQVTAKGVRSVHLTKEARLAFDAALKPAYDGELSKLLGKKLLERIRATKDGTVPLEVPESLVSHWPVGP